MQPQKKIARTRTVGFRMTEADYTALVMAAEEDQRHIAELVRLMVLDALKRRTVRATEIGAKGEGKR